MSLSCQSHFHKSVRVVRADKREKGVSTTLFKKQIAVLNQAYKGAAFKFTLAGIRRIVSPRYSPIDVYSPGFMTMKSNLRKGTPADLNVYVTKFNNGGVPRATPPPPFPPFQNHAAVQSNECTCKAAILVNIRVW